MELKTIASENHADSSEGQTGMEIDLYSDLDAFSTRSEIEQHDAERIIVTPPGEELPETTQIDVVSGPAFETEPLTPSVFVEDVAAAVVNPVAIDVPTSSVNQTEQAEAFDLDRDSIFGEAETNMDRVATASPTTCPACGAESNGDDLLCISCGAFFGEFGSDAPSVTVPTCPDCYAEVVPEDVFCTSCGTVLG